MFTLIGLGTARGYMEVWLTLSRTLPLLPRHARRRFPLYFEAAAVITTLVLLGQGWELRARQRPAEQFERCSTSRRSKPICSQRTDQKRCCARSGKARRPLARRPGERVACRME